MFAVAWLLMACSAPVTVPSVPPEDAPPLAVLNAYLGAWRAGDCATSQVLETPSYAASQAGKCGQVEVTTYQIDPNPATPTADWAEFSATVTQKGGDETLDGTHTLFFGLLRQPTGAWRVSDVGTGP